MRWLAAFLFCLSFFSMIWAGEQPLTGFPNNGYDTITSLDSKEDIQDTPDYWCPKIVFVGKSAEIFVLKKCEYISGITIKIGYNGKFSYPSKLKFTCFDSNGNVMKEDKTKRVFGPRRLDKGQYGIFTIQINGDENPFKIQIEGMWAEK